MSFVHDELIERIRAELTEKWPWRSLDMPRGSLDRPMVAESDVMHFVDLTLLKPEATSVDIENLCTRATKLEAKTVCVASRLVDVARRALRGTNVLPIAVIGFPHANVSWDITVAEALDAIRSGARELDMVLPVGLLKAGELDLTLHYLSNIISQSSAPEAGIPVKVILETCLLTPEEIVIASFLSVLAGASFVKTSTGFATAGAYGGADSKPAPTGATIEAVQLMRRTVGDTIGVKASGGIKTRAQAVAMLQAGANRIGTSTLT